MICETCQNILYALQHHFNHKESKGNSTNSGKILILWKMTASKDTTGPYGHISRAYVSDSSIQQAFTEVEMGMCIKQSTNTTNCYKLK